MDAAVRRNFSLGILHEGLWGAAMGLVSPFTILPLAAHALGRSVADAGLMEAALFAGINAPQLLAAFVFGPRFSAAKACAWLHTPCLAGSALACLSLIWPGLDPDLRWKLFLGAFILHYVGMGIVVPSWAALSSRNIPKALLGRYFGSCFAASGALGILTGSLGAWLAGRGGLEWGYAACCAAAFGLQVVSVVLLGMTRPIGPEPDAPGKLGSFLRSQWARLHGQPAFLAFFAVYFLMQFAGGAAQLFTSLLKDQGVADIVFVWLSPAMAIGGMVGAYGLGHLFDARGGRLPWALAFSAGLGSLASLYFSNGHLLLLAGAFAGAGLFNAAYSAINMPWLLSFAGSSQTPAVMGLVSTLISPWCFLAPYLLGHLARNAGMGAAFSLSAGAGLCALLLVSLHPALGRKEA